MCLLDKLISTGSGLFTKSYPDYSYGLIRHLGIENMLQAGQWAAFENIIYSLNSEDLTRLLDGICLTDRYERALKNYFSTEKSEVKQLISGAHNLYLAWKLRGANVGNSLTGKQVDGFIFYLEKSSQDFSYDFSSPILEAESCARLVRVYMGFSDTEAAQSAYSTAIQLIPNHLLAHLNYFKVTSPKWLGNLEIMASFVNQVVDAELKNLLQLMYLVEVYSDLFYSFSLTANSKFQKLHGQLIKEALAANTVPSGNSLLAIYTCNYLACLYQILGFRKEVSAIKPRLKGRRTIYPWAYFGWV
ncbi:hypothetical protein [Hymenobacter coccineus]|uniref:hypothetical protein n=1 Tax=Hymenobacter coccineus TaxID=1908235 RepID=UPI000F7B5D45|nr:hypothetical protein [Hymenobacter coccineus]